jgi:hypothetical protein
MSIAYEEALSKHDDLNSFITQRDIFMSSSFDDFIVPDDGFREWITPKYIASYKECSAQALDKKIIWKLTRLASLKSPCTSEGTQQCNDIIAAIALGHLKEARNFKETLVGGNLSIANDANYIFTSPWTNTYNRLTENYANLREEYAQIAYDVAMHFKKYSKESNFYAVIKAIKEAKATPELRSKIKPHADNLKDLEEIVQEKTGGGVSPWTIVAIVLIVLRIIMRLARD